MTFLSITPERFDADAATTRRVVAHQGPRASTLAQVAAILIVSAGMTVPGAVVQAKWSKLNLVVTIVQHRCMAALSA